MTPRRFMVAWLTTWGVGMIGLVRPAYPLVSLAGLMMVGLGSHVVANAAVFADRLGPGSVGGRLFGERPSSAAIWRVFGGGLVVIGVGWTVGGLLNWASS